MGRIVMGMVGGLVLAAASPRASMVGHWIWAIVLSWVGR